MGQTNMSDELNQDAEYSGNNGGGEDPILVAQRYLNIFHQIHIFNDKRKKEFDDSLLQLPSNIRILLSTLPGGSILIDHIAKLENKNNPKTESKSNTQNKETFQSSLGSNFKASNTEKKISPVTHEQAEKKSQSTENISNNNAINSDILNIIQKNELQHTKDMEMLFEMMARSQENIASVLKEVLTATTLAAQTNAQIIQQTAQKSEIKKEEQYQKQPEEVKEEHKEENDQTEPEINTDVVSKKQEKEKNKKKEKKEKNKTQETKVEVTSENKGMTDKKSDDKEKEKTLNEPETSKVSETAQGTKKNFFDLTKKIFTTLKPSEKSSSEPVVSAPEIDQTPVSLDDLSDTPVSLNDHSDLSIPEPQPEILPETSNQDDEDWDWEYIEEPDDEQSDDEWEYVETPIENVQQDNTTLNDETDNTSLYPNNETYQGEPDPNENLLKQNQQNSFYNENPDVSVYHDGQVSDHQETDFNSYEQANNTLDPNLNSETYPDTDFSYQADNTLAPENNFVYDEMNDANAPSDFSGFDDTNNMDSLLNQFAGQNEENNDALWSQYSDSDALLNQFADQNTAQDTDALLSQFADQNTAQDTDALLSQFADQNTENTDSLLEQFNDQNKEDKP